MPGPAVGEPIGQLEETAFRPATLDVDRSPATMSSVLYDAVLVAGGRASVDTLAGNGDAVHYVAEAFKHAKPIAAPGRGHRLGAPRLTAGCAAGRRRRR